MGGHVSSPSMCPHRDFQQLIWMVVSLVGKPGKDGGVSQALVWQGWTRFFEPCGIAVDPDLATLIAGSYRVWLTPNLLSDDWEN